MRHTKLIALLTALLLCVSLASSALAAESALSDLWDSGCKLLFDTDNVTVTGEATFCLDSVRFKTAKLNYVQDGYRSYYDLTLLTPRKSGEEQETGWIIITGEDPAIYVMERYEPGIYHVGGDTVQSRSLLRSSTELDAIFSLGGVLVAQVEPLLPEGAVTVTEADGMKTVRLALNQDQIPAVVTSAMNVGFNYLSDRWFNYSHDRKLDDYDSAFENYVSVTAALTSATVRWSISGVDASFAMDDQGRLTAAQGTLRVISTFMDGVDREVSVDFDLTMTDYRKSHVEAFDPEDYGVSLPDWYYGDDTGYQDYPSLTGEEWDALVEKSQTILTAQGYEVPENCDWAIWGDWDGMCYVELYPSDAEVFIFAYSEDGVLWYMRNSTAGWLYSSETEVEGVEDDVIASAQALALSFITEYNPDLAESMKDLAVDSMMTDEDGGVFLTFYGAEADALFVIRVEPSLRLEFMSASGNG